MNTVEQFKKYMVDNHTTNLGPDFSKTNDPYDDIYRALAVLIGDSCRHDIGLDEIPKKPFCKLVMSNASEYYKQLLNDEVALREFDNLYSIMVDTWNGSFDDIDINPPKDEEAPKKEDNEIHSV